MASVTIADLAASLGAEFVGDGNFVVSCVSHPKDTVRPGAMAMAMSTEFVETLSTSDFRAAVLIDNVDWSDLGLDAAILIKRPRTTLAKITQLFADAQELEAGIHPTAQVHDTARLGNNVSLGAFVVIGAGASIGDDAQIMDHSSVGAHVSIGHRALVHSGVRIGRNVTIGSDVIIHQNTVIGADGFSFASSEMDSVAQAKTSHGNKADVLKTTYSRIHSLGAVTIGNNVELGACSTVDRGTLIDTCIGSDTKIDNQVQIGHNVQIGSNCLICAQVGLAGSAVIGDRVVLGGKAGVADHVRIGDDVLVAAASAVASNVTSGNIMMGIPAQNRDQAMQSLMALRRLPRLLEHVEKLRKHFSTSKT